MDDTDPQAESSLRRRAAVLLALLAVVAVLFVVLLSFVLHSGGGNKNGGPAPLDTAANQQTGSNTGSTPSGATRASTTSSAPATGATGASCPTSATCALDSDIGNAVAAINAYRTQHGLPTVSGSVSDPAKQCALSNGSSCTGSWAESQVPGPDGNAAVAKIAQLGKVLDPTMTSFGVGWAYNPQNKQYFFAFVRNG